MNFKGIIGAAIFIALSWGYVFAWPYFEHHKLVVINTDRANSGDCEGEVQKRIKPFIK